MQPIATNDLLDVDNIFYHFFTKTNARFHDVKFNRLRKAFNYGLVVCKYVFLLYCVVFKMALKNLIYT